MTVGKWPTWPPHFFIITNNILFVHRTSPGWSKYHGPLWLGKQIKKVQRVQWDDQVPELLRAGQRQVPQLLRQLHLAGSGLRRLPQLLASSQHPGNGWISSGQKRRLWPPGYHDLGPQREHLHDRPRILQSWLQFWTVWLRSQQPGGLQQREGRGDLPTAGGAHGGEVQATLLGGEHGPGQDCLRRMEEGGGAGEQKGGNCKQRKRRRDCKMQFSSERGMFHISWVSGAVIFQFSNWMLYSDWSDESGTVETRGRSTQSTTSIPEDNRMEPQERYHRSWKGKCHIETKIRKFL